MPARLALLPLLFACAACSVRGDDAALLDAGTDAALHDAAPPDLARDFGTIDGSVPAPPSARLIAPLATALVHTRRPTLRAEAPPATAGVVVEIRWCADRACSAPLGAGTATDGVVRPAVALAEGVVFWQARNVRPGTELEPEVDGEWTAPWTFRVPASDADVDTATGASLDADGDGVADLYTWDELHGGLLRLGRAGGEPVVAPGGPQPVEPFAAITGDFDGDGLSDLAFAEADGTTSSRVGVFYAQPGGTFSSSEDEWITPVHDPDVTPAVDLLYVGDVDHDGYGDVLLMGLEPAVRGVETLLYGSADGLVDRGLPEDRLDVAHRGTFVSAGDVDGDGYPDVLLVGTSGPEGLVWLPLRGGLDASAEVPLDVAGRQVTAASLAGAADVDGDGYSDVVLFATSPDPTVTPDLLLLRGSPAGLAIDRTGPVPTALGGLLAVGDTDHDGCEEMLGVEETSARMWSWCPSLHAVPGTDYVGTLRAPYGGSGLAFTGHTDMNGDAVADYVTMEWGSGAPTLWLSTGSAAWERIGVTSPFVVSGN